MAANGGAKTVLGIRGRANFAVDGRTISGQTNRNGNDGTIARFGWKAQNKSLLLFSGEAYNVEMGISNELFQTERDETANCHDSRVTPTASRHPEAATDDRRAERHREVRVLHAPAGAADAIAGHAGRSAVDRQRQECVQFRRVRASATRRASRPATRRSPRLRNKPVDLYSDLLVHDMGLGLADGISQGQAGPREFRTAPLWGLGQRIFFLHDGRTSDLAAAIRAHQSIGSEANAVSPELPGPDRKPEAGSLQLPAIAVAVTD